jgi:hypothetical protein
LPAADEEMSAEIVADVRLVGEVMSAEIAADMFGRGSRRKSRLSPAVNGEMSGKIAEGDFAQ